MAEKNEYVGNDIISYYLNRQIDFLYKAQEKAFSDGNIQAVCEISNEIMQAVKCLDMYERSERIYVTSQFEKVLRSSCKSVRPPSNKLLQAAVEIYGMENIDGQSGDGILKKIWEAECRFWKRL